MASGSSLTNLWVDDGTGNLIPVTQTATVVGSQLPNDVLQFYEDAGVDSLAREAGIIEDEEVVATTITSPPPPPPISRTIKLIAVPISSAQKATVKVENGAPRTVRISAPSQNIISATPIVFASSSGTTFHASQVVTPKVIQLMTAAPVPGSSSASTAALCQSNQSWSSVAAASRKRIADPYENMISDSKRRKGEKSGGKGLRHFSMKVCEKVQRKGVTTYNEVADELVSELSDLQGGGLIDYTGSQQFDQKNIRRRVYDALNVLMAMNIISKKKKVPTATLR